MARAIDKKRRLGKHISHKEKALLAKHEAAQEDKAANAEKEAADKLEEKSGDSNAIAKRDAKEEDPNIASVQEVTTLAHKATKENTLLALAEDNDEEINDEDAPEEAQETKESRQINTRLDQLR